MVRGAIVFKGNDEGEAAGHGEGRGGSQIPLVIGQTIYNIKWNTIENLKNIEH